MDSIEIWYSIMKESELIDLALNNQSNFTCILASLIWLIPLFRLSDVNVGFTLSSHTPFDLFAVILLVLVAVLKYL